MTDTPPPRLNPFTPWGRLPQAPLQRRWLLNLGLLVVIAGLALFAWYRSGVAPEETKQPLTNLSPDTVERVEIERPQQPTVRLERADGNWRLVAPINARGDVFAIGSLLQLLRAPADATIASAAGADLARYGLDQPRLTVRVDGAEIRFGEAHPLKDDYYVQHGPAVHLIPSRYYAYAAAPPRNYIDSRLIEPGRKPVALKLPDLTLTLSADGEWRRQPEIEALSSDRINAFVDEWRHARALQVQAYTGLKMQERVDITFEHPDGSRSDLTVGVLTRRPELVLYRPDEGLQYHFPETMDQRLLNLSEK